MKTDDEADPKDLIREAFRIEGITAAECRSIFLDWAMSLPDGISTERGVKRMLSRHQAEPADHPMQTVLREALTAPATAGRRGGRAGRIN